MRKTEYILLITFLASLILKLIWPKNVANTILIPLSLNFIFGLYILLSWFLFKDRITKKGNTFISFVCGTFIAITIYGILFKVMIWQRGQELLIYGTASLGMLSLYLFSYYKIKNFTELQNYYSSIKFRTILFLILGLIFLIIPSSSFIKIYERDEPEYAEIRIRAFENPNNEQYQAEEKAYFDKILKRKFEDFSKKK